MDERERLWELIAKTPYLVVDQRTAVARLVTPAEVITVMGDGEHYVLDLRRRQSEIKRMLSKDEYKLRELAQMAGVEYQVAYWWQTREQVITPSIRPMGNGKGHHALFSFADVYSASVIGLLRRQGAGLQSLRKIQPLFCDTKNQAARKTQTSKRP